LERIQSWLKKYPDVVKAMDLNKLLLPLDFYEDDIRDTIVSFASSKYEKNEFQSIEEKYFRISIERKNKLNNVSADYFRDFMRKSYVHFGKISNFLKDPSNLTYKEKYENTVADIQGKITVRREDFKCFDDILLFLYEIILDKSNNQLLSRRRYIWVFLHFMYASCDIGKKVEENVVP
jgi:hypothetical protein